MLGRKNYAQEELNHSRSEVDQQLTAYKQLAGVLTNGTTSEQAKTALSEFEAPFFNNMTLALDRPFVHRLRMVAGKDGNPLNEVELICDALINNEGVFRTNNVIKSVPAKSVVKLRWAIRSASAQTISNVFRRPSSRSCNSSSSSPDALSRATPAWLSAAGA
jgi:hypothetical protein